MRSRLLEIEPEDIIWDNLLSRSTGELVNHTVVRVPSIFLSIFRESQSSLLANRLARVALRVAIVGKGITTVRPSSRYAPGFACTDTIRIPLYCGVPRNRNDRNPRATYAVLVFCIPLHQGKAARSARLGKAIVLRSCSSLLPSRVGSSNC